MASWLRRYCGYLTRRADAAEHAAARYSDVQMIALPWLIPLAATVILSAVSETVVGLNSTNATIGIVLVLGAPALLGMAFSLCVYLVAAVRAERRRKEN